jgi:predicted SnoaL-like aldol condensation-catalyzing enzyme
MTKSMKKAISVFVFSGILASSSIAQTKSTSEVNLSNKKTNKMTNSKEAANNAFLALFKDYSEEGVKKYIATDFIQHNPFVPSGRDALIGFLPALKKSGITYTNHRILQDGEFVVLHNSFTNAQAFGAEKIVTIDIYRMKGGQAVEHWDCINPIAEKTASGRTQTDGPTTVEDLDKTEANKKLAVSLIEDVLMGKNPSKISEYISATEYNQHNPQIKDGLTGIIEAVQYLTSQDNMFKYTKIHKVLGEGNFVLTVSEGEWNGGKKYAFYDLFRMKGGKIVEHWDVIQEVPTTGLANTNGMFGGF